MRVISGKKNAPAMDNSEKTRDELTGELKALRARLDGAVCDAGGSGGGNDSHRITPRGLRSAISIASEIITAPDLDTLFRRSVELARTKLGLERCSFFVEREGELHGTYGTDMQGQTTGEHGNAIPKMDDTFWRNRFQSLGAEDARWIVE